MSTILRQSWLISVKDTRIFIRDRFALGFALLFPLIFVIGFSFGLAGVGPSNDRVEFTIVTLEADGGISHQIIEALTAAPDSSVQTLPYQDAIRAVEDGNLSGFLAFPGDFTSNVMAGQPTELEVVADAEAPATQAALEGIGFLHRRPAHQRPDDLAGRDRASSVGRSLLAATGATHSFRSEATRQL